MTDSIRFYDRAVQRLTRRQLLNVAWKLGAAAVAQPLFRRACSRSRSSARYPFTLGVASGRSVARQRGAVDAPGAGAARRRRHADGQRRSRMGGGARIAPLRRSCRRAPRSRGRSSAIACTSSPRGSSRVAITSIAFAPAARSARSDERRRRRPTGSRSTACDLRSAAAITTSRATSPRSGASRRSSSTSSSTPATTSTKAGATAAGIRARAAASRQRDLHARRLPQPLRAVQVGSRLESGARLGAVHRHVGRSRGRQRLRRRSRRERHAARSLPAAARRRLPGLLRGDAAAAVDSCRPDRTCGCIAACSSAACWT